MNDSRYDPGEEQLTVMIARAREIESVAKVSESKKVKLVKRRALSLWSSTPGPSCFEHGSKRTPPARTIAEIEVEGSRTMVFVRVGDGIEKVVFQSDPPGDGGLAALLAAVRDFNEFVRYVNPETADPDFFTQTQFLLADLRGFVGQLEGEEKAYLYRRWTAERIRAAPGCSRTVQDSDC